jgi:hypothetical protein
MFGNPNCKQKAIQEALVAKRALIISGKPRSECNVVAEKVFKDKKSVCKRDEKLKKKK